MVKHLAFTMIELIFAIVIIAFAVLSLPIINNVLSKNIEGSMTQEAIFAASAELNQVLTLYWDSNSMEDNATLSRVVWENNADCSTTTQRRPGHIDQPLHRRCRDNNVSRPSIPLEASIGNVNPRNLNDVNLTAHNIFIDTSKSASGYKKIYNSDIDIIFASIDKDYTTGNNMKKITVTITDENGDVVTLLRTFSANIGEIDYHKRSY